MNIDIPVSRFQQWLRQEFGATDLRHDLVIRNEYSYKSQCGQRMRQQLSPAAFRQVREGDRWEEVCRQVKSFFAIKGGMAYRNEFQWLLHLIPEGPQAFVLALERFLYGEEPFLDRLERFTEDAGQVYAQFLDPSPKYQERYGGKKLSWPFVSYFHFMMWPEQGYAFIKPLEIQEAARAAGFDLKYQGQPNRTTYERAQEFYRLLWPAVERLGGRDWIDVQTVIRAAGGGFGIPGGVWIDQRVAQVAAALSPAVTKVTALLHTKPQVVLQGAPGTGKTHTALLAAANVLGVVEPEAEATRQALRRYQLARHLEDTPALIDDPQGLADRVRAAGHGLCEIVQLHPSYTYEDFVRGLQAVPSGERVTFRAVNRTLGLLAETASALLDDHLPVVLILDEINRGDLSKVLGELIYVLEYRSDSVLTPYAVDGRLDLTLPPNLYLIGTMNTADRSIALVDYAIRRRFYFVTLRADRDVIVGYYHDRLALGQRAVILFDAVSRLFDELQTGYDRHDLMVGHTYFLAKDAESLALKFAYDVVPLLREYQREGLLESLKLDLEGTSIDLAQGEQPRLLAQISDWLEATEVES